ncbi:MAG: AAA family ATPase [Acidimicrobiaceae bacterium]|nr:AAA family ATPase [Acidimicrobiaceae bacterium]
MTTVAFFNNKGGVGKTSLVYHLAWMFADIGKNVIAADLDPQANLTAMFIDDDGIERLWNDDNGATIYHALTPLLNGTGDISAPNPHQPTPGLSLITGDLRLSAAEDDLSSQWPLCLSSNERAFRVISAFGRVLGMAAEAADSSLVLVDVGPNLGALNRSALVAADYVVVPLAPDPYSLQGLRNLGPTLTRWRSEWRQRLDNDPPSDLVMPDGRMEPLGYVVMQHAMRLDRPVQAYARWMERIPRVYAETVAQTDASPAFDTDDDINCLGTLKHFRSLMPYAQDARKPMFKLTAADGAVGGRVKAVRGCYDEFYDLAQVIADRARFDLHPR